MSPTTRSCWRCTPPTGPAEPSVDAIQKIFRLTIVRELRELYDGIEVMIGGHKTIVSAVLGCSSCDLPAARKFGGQIGHGAGCPCSKCWIKYLEMIGFDVAARAKTGDKHQSFADAWVAAKSIADRKRVLEAGGVRPCALLEAPGYDSVKTPTIDSMH